MNRMNKVVSTVLLTTLLLSGCDEEPITNQGSGTLSLSIVDAPVDGATKVEITINSVELKPYSTEVITHEFATPITIDLLQHQGSNARILLDNQTVVGGTYSWVRLNVDDTASYLANSTGLHKLVLPNTTAENLLRIDDNFTVPQDGSIALTIDFDLRNSIFEPLAGSSDYRLVPALRLVDESTVGKITGTVPNTMVNASGCGTSAVYLFEGSNVTADDLDGVDAEPFNSSQKLTLNTSSSDYDYELAFIPAGNYTIAFTCKANLDDPETNDATVTFNGSEHTVTVTAGETTTQNF